jgi:hypothetical protein
MARTMQTPAKNEEEIIQNKRKQLGRVNQLQQVKHKTFTNKRNRFCSRNPHGYN